MEIKIENLDTNTIEKIDCMAKKKGLKRSEFLERYVKLIALKDELFNAFSKYENIYNDVEKALLNNTEILNKINYL